MADPITKNKDLLAQTLRGYPLTNDQMRGMNRVYGSVPKGIFAEYQEECSVKAGTSANSITIGRGMVNCNGLILEVENPITLSASGIPEGTKCIIAIRGSLTTSGTQADGNLVNDSDILILKGSLTDFPTLNDDNMSGIVGVVDVELARFQMKSLGGISFDGTHREMIDNLRSYINDEIAEKVTISKPEELGNPLSIDGANQSPVLNLKTTNDVKKITFNNGSENVGNIRVFEGSKRIQLNSGSTILDFDISTIKHNNDELLKSKDAFTEDDADKIYLTIISPTFKGTITGSDAHITHNVEVDNDVLIDGSIIIGKNALARGKVTIENNQILVTEVPDRQIFYPMKVTTTNDKDRILYKDDSDNSQMSIYGFTGGSSKANRGFYTSNNGMYRQSDAGSIQLADNKSVYSELLNIVSSLEQKSDLTKLKQDLQKKLDLTLAQEKEVQDQDHTGGNE